MSLLCSPCNKTFATKASLERHVRSDMHAKCVACLETQPKITEYFALEAKIAAQDEVILELSEKVSALETTTAALQATTVSLTEQVTALVQANVQLVHAAEITELKLAHALELVRASGGQNPPLASTPYARTEGSAPAPAPDIMALQAQMVTLQAKIDKPRHTGAENHQIQIEKWFNHPRKYGEAKDKDGDSKVCGIRDLAVKLQTIYTDNPDLAPGDNFTRLLDIYKKEVDSQTDNPITLQTAYMALKHRVFKWSKEDTDYLNYSISFESPNHLARWGMTREFLEQGDAANVLMPAPKPSSEPETTASANQRLLAEYEKREADTLEAMEESNNKIRKLFEEVLQENIAIIKAEYEGEEQKDKMAEEYMDNAKKLKQKLANNKREEDEHDLKEIRKAIAKLKK